MYYGHRPLPHDLVLSPSDSPRVPLWHGIDDCNYYPYHYRKDRYNLYIDNMVYGPPPRRPMPGECRGPPPIRIPGPIPGPYSSPPLSPPMSPHMHGIYPRSPPRFPLAASMPGMPGMSGGHPRFPDPHGRHRSPPQVIYPGNPPPPTYTHRADYVSREQLEIEQMQHRTFGEGIRRELERQRRHEERSREREREKAKERERERVEREGAAPANPANRRRSSGASANPPARASSIRRTETDGSSTAAMHNGRTGWNDRHHIRWASQPDLHSDGGTKVRDQPQNANKVGDTPAAAVVARDYASEPQRSAETPRGVHTPAMPRYQGGGGGGGGVPPLQSPHAHQRLTRRGRVL